MAKMAINLQDVLEDLSYSWATPEAEHFFALVGKNDLDAARKILKKNIDNDEEIEAVLAHYIAEANQKYTLEEIAVKDVPLIDDGAQYLINCNGAICATSLYNNRGEWVFFLTREMLPVMKARQVWKVVKQ